MRKDENKPQEKSDKTLLWNILWPVTIPARFFKSDAGKAIAVTATFLLHSQISRRIINSEGGRTNGFERVSVPMGYYLPYRAVKGILNYGSEEKDHSPENEVPAKADEVRILESLKGSCSTKVEEQARAS